MNKPLADKLVDLIETGIGIGSNEIFCSSLEGMGIPSGSNFVTFIKDQITSPKVVILLLTQSYYRSLFCVCEMGASWALSHKIIPILVPPLQYTDMKAVLNGIQALNINNTNDLNQMRDELVEKLTVKGNAFAKWEVKRDQFLENIKSISEPNIDPTVDYKKFTELSDRYSEAVQEFKNYEEKLAAKDKIIEELKKLKDVEEVKELLNNSLNDFELLNKLISECEEKLSALPNIVKEAVFKFYRGEKLSRPGFGEEYIREEINRAIENDYLSDNHSEIQINREDPKISRAIKSLDNLKTYIEEKNSNDKEFCDNYEQKYDHQVNFISKRFWTTHLL